MYERVCVNCQEVFNPIEGNETRDFCSDDCETSYYDDVYAEVQLEDYGIAQEINKTRSPK